MEELEYAALGRAALGSLRRLAADPGAARRRVVVAVDVPDAEVAVDPDRGLDRDAVGEVRLARPVRLAKAAAVHVDADDAEADVAAAAAALGRGGPGRRRRPVHGGRGRGPRADVVRGAGDPQPDLSPGSGTGRCQWPPVPS
ncbi:hypothetical protein GCM10020221_22320 [Streptomyces thioluteus]|uniref:Uncharacterized protein n=1 Tax=Streptomyces thioluteus TaxID=66431 RepID=A0ABN3WS22_STRTU